jgi:hypothetical protein
MCGISESCSVNRFCYELIESCTVGSHGKDIVIAVQNSASAVIQDELSPSSVDHRDREEIESERWDVLDIEQSNRA